MHCAGSDSGRTAVPDSLLVDVLVAVYTATAKAHLDGTDPKVARAEAVKPFGIDTAALDRKLEYLADNPDSASVIYQMALDSLVVVERKLKTPLTLDSLRRGVRG